MRFLRPALCALLLPVLGVRARADDSKDDSADHPQAPEEIPNFNQLDEYIYVPKSTLSLGTRFFLHGPKASYSGQGDNPSTVDSGAENVPNVSHTYLDGSVSPDQRTVSVQAGLGGTTTQPIAPDGRTNTWSYDYATQLLPNGNIAFHSYDEEVVDTATHTTTAAPNLGLELILDRDMGKLGKHFKWSLTAGFSIGDIHASTYQSVPTLETTTTDTYDLFGQVPPSAPFTSPNTITQTVYGQGSSVTLQTGTSTATQQATQTILLGNQPLSRVDTFTDTYSLNRYFTEGAYYTLRAGPTLDVPIGSKWNLTVSAGPALIYAGSIMNVLEDFQLVAGTNYYTLYQKENNHILPGYYVDVNLQYALTEKAGLYLGGMIQGAGSFTQTVASGTGINGAYAGVGTEYSSKINFGDQQGLKGGLTVRF